MPTKSHQACTVGWVVCQGCPESSPWPNTNTMRWVFSLFSFDGRRKQTQDKLESQGANEWCIKVQTPHLFIVFYKLLMLPLAQKKWQSSERHSSKTKQLWLITSNCKPHRAVAPWHSPFPCSQSNTGFRRVPVFLFLSFTSSSTLSERQILRNLHNLITMLAFSLVILLCLPSQLRGFQGRKCDFCFLLYFC